MPAGGATLARPGRGAPPRPSHPARLQSPGTATTGSAHGRAALNCAPGLKDHEWHRCARQRDHVEREDGYLPALPRLGDAHHRPPAPRQPRRKGHACWLGRESHAAIRGALPPRMPGCAGRYHAGVAGGRRTTSSCMEEGRERQEEERWCVVLLFRWSVEHQQTRAGPQAPPPAHRSCVQQSNSRSAQVTSRSAAGGSTGRRSR